MYKSVIRNIRRGLVQPALKLPIGYQKTFLIFQFNIHQFSNLSKETQLLEHTNEILAAGELCSNKSREN